LLECNIARSVWTLEGEEIVELLQHFQMPDAKGWLSTMLQTLSHS
jgi:hypothetical protein